MMRSGLHLLTLVLIIAPAWGQSPAAADDAAAWLARAMDRQDPAKVARTIDSYESRASFRFIEEVKGESPAAELTGNIAQFWARRRRADGAFESAYRREMTVDGAGRKVMVAPFDDLFYLLDGKRPVLLDGKDYEVDRRRLGAERRQIGRLLDLLLLRRLEIKSDSLRLREGTEEVSFVIGPARRLGTRKSVARVLDLVDGDERTVTLWLDRETYALIQARIVDGASAEEFRMSGSIDAPVRGAESANSAILRIPREIQYLEDGKLKLEVVANDEGLAFNSIDEPMTRKLLEFRD